MAVSEAHSSLTSLIDVNDVKLGGVLLANMLAGWLEDHPNCSAVEEAADEPEDYRTPPEQTCLHLPTPVDTGASAPPSREHGAPICPAREGAGTGLERFGHPHSRPGSGDVGSTSNGAGRLQDPGRGGLDGSGGRGVCAGSLATGALEFRLASLAGVMCAHRDAGDRRRWLLQPSGFQRRPAAGVKGADGSGRASFFTCAPPGWQAQQSQERRVAFPTPGGVLLRRRKPNHPGLGRRGAGCRGLGISSLSRDRYGLCRDATICGKRITIPQALLRWGLGWPDPMGSSDAQPCAGPAQEPVLCREVCLWPVSDSPSDQLRR